MSASSPGVNRQPDWHEVEPRLLVYVGALGLTLIGFELWLVRAGYSPSSFWLLVLLAPLAALAERNTIRLSSNLEVTVSLVPILLAAVTLGPVGASITGAASMLGDLRGPLARWGAYAFSASLTGGLTGIVAVTVTDAFGHDVADLLAATFAAAFAAQAVDATFCLTTLVLRRTGGIRDLRPVAPTLFVSAALYAPLVAGLALAYERISPWTLVLFVVPAIAAQRLLVLYQRQRSLATEVAAANAHLRRRDAILEAVSTAAQRFLEPTSLGNAVEQMLAELGGATGAEHVCVVETRGDDASPRYAWSRPGAGPLPPMAVDTDGAVAVPIVSGQERWGWIGFSERRDEPWSAAEIEGLRAAAGILGAAIERERAEEELRFRDEQLRQSQKMEAIGRLAGGIAHDFNNLLTAIGGYSDLLVAALEPGDPRHADALEIRKAADRAGALTGQLLAFSRKQVLAPRILDLNDVLRDTDSLLRRVLGEDIELAVQLDGSLPRLLADPGHLQQIVLNLAVNARDAMPNGGTLLLRTANVVGNAVPHGSSVLLEVADTGQGMDAATCARIFEPFFTTKDVGKGTGLGLATVHGIVEQTGGRIEVESEPGRGTVFRIYFPVAEQATAAPAPVAPAEPPGGTETILLVEDERTVRDLAGRVLRAHGYTVLEAADATQALAVSDDYEGLIDLLLTDVVMPGSSGRALAEQIASRRLFTKTLFMSGYAADPTLPSTLAARAAGFLPKPFTRNGLLSAVREALDAAGHGSGTVTSPSVPERPA